MICNLYVSLITGESLGKTPNKGFHFSKNTEMISDDTPQIRAPKPDAHFPILVIESSCDSGGTILG
jgi:hypothetical protein